MQLQEIKHKDGAVTRAFTTPCGVLICLYRKEVININAFIQATPINLSDYPLSIAGARQLAENLTDITKE